MTDDEMAKSTTREAVINLVYELVVLLRPEGDLEPAAEEKILEINARLCAGLGISATEPL